jgi:hypothetical protein
VLPNFGLSAPNVGVLPPILGLLAALAFVPLRFLNTSPRPHPVPILGLLTEPGPKYVSPDILGELKAEVVESAGEAPGDEVLRMDDVPSEGDFQRYFSAKEGPRRRGGRWAAAKSASAMRRNWASLMARRSKLSKVDMVVYSCEDRLWMFGM